MLTDIHLTNYRGFQDHTVPFQKTSIVVGANNAGKSTVIEALRLLSIVASRFGSVNFSEAPRGLASALPRSYRGFSPSLKGIDFNDKSIFHKLGEPPAEIRATFTNDVTVNIYIGQDADIFAVVFDPQGRAVTTKAMAQRLEIPQISILPQVAPISREEFLLDAVYARRTIPATWSSIHFRNQIQLYPEYYEDFKRLVELTWKDLRVVQLDLAPDNTQTQLLLTLYDGSFITEAGWVGHGLQMWLQTMWFLARAQHSSSIILDEPDVYMHADLQRKLIRLLKSYDKQVIVATHSVEIMSEVEPEEILVVNRRAKKSGFADSVPYVQNFVRNIGSVHNLQLARIWNARKLILVEGPDDINYMRMLHHVLFPKSSESFDTIPIIGLGGWSGWRYATGYPNLLKNAFDENIITYCLFDSDYFPEETINERIEEAKKKKIQIHIWNKKEMENYFVVPAAIQRIIAREMRKGNSSPTIEEISQIITSITDSLKDEVIDNISTYIQHRETKLSAGSAHRIARQKVDDLWGTDDGRLSIVSGKELITKLSQWSQQKYGVILNGERILRSLKPTEVDKEVAQVVAIIEKAGSLNI